MLVPGKALKTFLVSSPDCRDTLSIVFDKPDFNSERVHVLITPATSAKADTDYRFDFEPTEGPPDPRLSPTDSTQHVAVNAFYNVSRSADYFKQAFALESWATGTTRVTVHHNANGKVSHRGDAYYDSAEITEITQRCGEAMLEQLERNLNG